MNNVLGAFQLLVAAETDGLRQLPGADQHRALVEDQLAGLQVLVGHQEPPEDVVPLDLLRKVSNWSVKAILLRCQGFKSRRVLVRIFINDQLEGLSYHKKLVS